MLGLVTTIARTTWWVSPREPANCSTLISHGQHAPQPGPARSIQTLRGDPVPRQNSTSVRSPQGPRATSRRPSGRR
jgi:hypothetical protein